MVTLARQTHLSSRWSFNEFGKECKETYLVMTDADVMRFARSAGTAADVMTLREVLPLLQML